jgi:multidrug efflux system outer membrane protein
LNEAAKAQYLATEAARRGVLISLISDVASTYFRLRELDEELVIARNTAAAFQETSRLFERKLAEGAASALESSYAAAAYTENVLNVLLGRNPAAVARGAALADQPVAPEIPAGLPSDLLQRRPDIAQAEEQLIAANAGVGVATANFFPTISLTGLFGGVSPDVSDLFTPGRTWSIAAGLFGPLFQGGRLRSEYDVSYAQWEQAKLFYEQTVTNAFNETTTVLFARGKFAASVGELADSVGYYRDMVRLTNLRYNSGLSSYFEVLYSMQQLFPAEISLARARVNLLTNSVDIYKALGGGWNIANPTWLSPAAAPAPARPAGGASEP